jgi:hypothetical protein
MSKLIFTSRVGFHGTGVGSRMQSYRLTEAGLAILRTHQVSPSSASRQAPCLAGRVDRNTTDAHISD